MFSYLGAKQRILHLYPKPLYGTIIEPFCGSARYACRYGLERSCWINDLNPTIYGIWKWIQQASKQDIRALPVLKRGEDLRDYKQLSQAERDLLGFTIQSGMASPGNIASFFGTGQGKNSLNRKYKRKWNDKTTITKGHLLKLQGKISHWNITCLPYQEIPNQKATWFVDPPYEKMGHQYPLHDIDYQKLANWCKERKGQIMVCEAGSAKWLPFVSLLRKVNNIHKKAYTELLYYQSDKKTGFGIR